MAKDATSAEAHPMMPRIGKYLEVVETIDLGNITRSRLSNRTQCIHRRPALKKKGGNAPIDYSLAEQIADLRKAYNEGDVRNSIIIFAQLSRALPL